MEKNQWCSKMNEELKRCFETRELRETKPDLLKSAKSIEVSDKKLRKAMEVLKAKFFDLSILESYTSMFHASRALLYKDGIQEKSHYCTMVYIKEKYAKQIPINLINSFNSYRLERHAILYGIDFEATEEDARNALKESEEFVGVIKSILSKGRIK